jgi:hypothetical protein
VSGGVVGGSVDVQADRQAHDLLDEGAPAHASAEVRGVDGRLQ